jgi:hypothetical protein
MTSSLTSMLDLTRSKATTLSVVLPDMDYRVDITFEKPSYTSNMRVYSTEESALTDRTDNEALSAATSAKAPVNHADSDQMVPLTALQQNALQDYRRIGRLSQELIEE